MLFNRRQFLAASALFAAGCAAQKGGGSASNGGGGTTNVGRAGQYLNDGVYASYRNQGFFLVRRGSSLLAVSAICTHRKCKLQARANKTFYCPCHGSTFDTDGKVLTGPARRDLPIFALSTDEHGNLLVKTPSV